MIFKKEVFFDCFFHLSKHVLFLESHILSIKSIIDMSGFQIIIIILIMNYINFVVVI